MADSSQEKSLPATHHHLNKARERGQVATSAQFVSAAVAVAVILWLAARFRPMAAEFARLFDAVFGGGAFAPAEDIGAAIGGFVWMLIGLVAPIAFVGGLAGVAANIVHKGGLVVAFEPIAPDASRIALGPGFTRVFSRRNLLQLVSGLVGLSLFLAAAISIVTFLFPQILNSPLCGEGCAISAQTNAFTWLLAAGFIALIFAGAADLPLQQRLFQTDMKMTHQEQKQESRETDGSPEMRRHRRRAHIAIMRSGPGAPTLVVARGGEAVALRYHAADAPVPVVVAKGRDDAADRILRRARAVRTPIFVDAALTRRLMAAGRTGAPIPKSEFSAVAPYILKSKKRA